MTYAELQELEHLIGERLAGSGELSNLIGDRLYGPPLRDLVSATSACLYYSCTHALYLSDQAELFIGAYAPSLTEAESAMRVVDNCILALKEDRRIVDITLKDQRTEGKLIGVPGIGQPWVYQIAYRYLLECKAPAAGKPERKYD